MSTGRFGCRGHVMSDGRFAILRGKWFNLRLWSCEALVFDDNGDARWMPFPPMHEARVHFASGTSAGSIIVAGGDGLNSTELYDDERNRWFRLSCDLPYESGLTYTGSAVL